MGVTRMILLGVCAGWQKAAKIKEAGFDYIELSLSELASFSEEEYRKVKEALDKSGLPVYAANSMLPGRYCLYTEEGAIGALEFLETAYRRAHELGIKRIVFGSGAARMRPETVPEDEAYACLAAFLKQASQIAKKNDLLIAVEPLRREECNIINTVADGRRLAALADCENVRVLADLYHMAAGKEDLDTLLVPPTVIHTHIAESEKRSFPREGDGSDTLYESFFRNLKKAGYEGGVSVEGQSEDFEADIKAAFEILDMLRN